MSGLRDKVVVITGASSGIGRAAARLFAERGARLVLAARRAEELERVAAECVALGTRAIAVPTDVSDHAAVEVLAARAVSEFGAIDVWVNNAGVYMMGELRDVPLAVHHRIVEVNLLGVLYGMRAALAQFRAQGGGTIINIASQAGKAPYALASTYCATKAAVRALTESVRQEQGKRKIHVCAVSPPSVDTPLFQHAANYTGRVIKPPKPVYAVDKAARTIVECAERPKREVSVGIMPVVIGLFRTLAKPLWERIAPAMIRGGHLGQATAADAPGNLFQPKGPAGESGGWKRLRAKAAKPSLAPRALGTEP
ncbi:MAG: oxidoreductase, short-chain dehydrogenase/reductase family [bacterium]|nr:oxidoreductase, short-chain dehydrogenase/reductase family [bacterium]